MGQKELIQSKKFQDWFKTIVLFTGILLTLSYASFEITSFIYDAYIENQNKVDRNTPISTLFWPIFILTIITAYFFTFKISAHITHYISDDLMWWDNFKNTMFSEDDKKEMKFT